MKVSPAQPRHFLRGGLFLVACLGLGTGGWYAVRQNQTVARHLPERPELGSWPVELVEKITDAEGVARGYLRPKSGLVALSRLYHANGFFPEALLCYEGLRQLDPANGRWFHLPACILAEFGRLPEALPMEQSAILLAPDYLPARLRLGDILLKDNQVAAATQAYAQALDRNPGNPYALLGLARCAINNADWTKARELLRQAIQLHPDFVGALSLLVTVSEKLGDKGQVPSLKAAMRGREFSDPPDEWLASLVEDCHDAYRLSVASAVANAAGDLATARWRLERAITMAPTNGAFHRQLAVQLTREGNLNLARQHLEQATVLNPEDADSWVFLVKNLTSSGELQRAEQVLTKGLLACPQSPSLHLERARWWSKMGRPEEAIAEYRESYRLRPSEASPLVELATTLYSTGRVADATATLQEALRKQPNHPIAQATLALISISQGDEAKAREWWVQVRLQPETPDEVVATIRQAYRQQFGRDLP